MIQLGYLRNRVGSTRMAIFLNRADDAYMMAFRSHPIEPFISYAAPSVCTRVLQEIYTGEEPYFGVSKRRKRTWEVVSEDSDIHTCCETSPAQGTVL